MTPDKNFKMTPQTKTLIALSGGSRDVRMSFKRMMIDALLHEEAAKKASLRSKDNKDNRGKPRGAVALD